MSIQPLITFKAGRCDFDPSADPTKAIVKPIATPGYIYLHQSQEDDMLHFCWRPRSARMDEPEIDLLMFPEDGSFIPYTGGETSSSSDNLKSPTNGRIFVLKFNSSSQRHLFWLQSKSQGPSSKFSARDQKLGQIVDMLLSGENINVSDELRDLRNRSGGDDDDDEAMEDVEGADHSSDRRPRHGSGGAGPGATGGDIREEGSGSREGGADGGRAAGSGANDASTIVQNFLNSLQGGNIASGSRQKQADKPFTTLPDLLPSSVTVPVIDSAPDSFIDSLASHVPPMILLLAQEIDDLAEVDPNSETAQAAIQALAPEQKRDILRRVLRSPQLHQSLGSLTMALRDGGLPTVSEALKIKVKGGGLRGAMPLGGGEAVEAFLEGVKKTVEEENKDAGNRMDTD